MTRRVPLAVLAGMVGALLGWALASPGGVVQTAETRPSMVVDLVPVAERRPPRVPPTPTPTPIRITAGISTSPFPAAAPPVPTSYRERIARAAMHDAGASLYLAARIDGALYVVDAPYQIGGSTIYGMRRTPIVAVEGIPVAEIDPVDLAAMLDAPTVEMTPADGDPIVVTTPTRSDYDRCPPLYAVADGRRALCPARIAALARGEAP